LLPAPHSPTLLRSPPLFRSMAAAITVFDPTSVADKATFERPHQPSVGFAYVFVNGQKVLDHGTLTPARPGRGLRGPGYVALERRSEEHTSELQSRGHVVCRL